MELAAEANDGSLLSRAALLPSTAKYRAPALVGGNATVVARAPPTALDMYSVGALIHALYNGDAFSSGDNLRATTGAIPRLLVPTYRKLVAPSPANRPDPAAFRETGFFVSDFMELNDFLDNITIKSGSCVCCVCRVCRVRFVFCFCFIGGWVRVGRWK